MRSKWRDATHISTNCKGGCALFNFTKSEKNRMGVYNGENGTIGSSNTSIRSKNERYIEGLHMARQGWAEQITRIN